MTVGAHKEKEGVAMRIAVLSDIHGNDVAFEAVVKDMEKQGVNGVIFLGDLVAKGPQPQECFDRMAGLKPLVWLKGNTEYWLDNAMVEIMPTDRKSIRLLAYYDYLASHMNGQSMDHLIKLRKGMSVKLGYFHAYTCHGSPRDVEEQMYPADEGELLMDKLQGIKEVLIFHGHTHLQADVMYKHYRLINPGAVGIMNMDGETRACYAIIEEGQGFKVELRQVSYDFDALKKVASDRQFPNMEHWLKQMGHKELK